MVPIPPRVLSWMPEHLRSLEPYDPAFTSCETILSANENNHPMPREVAEAIARALAEVDPKRYPDPLQNELRDELAAWHGVPRECVIVGNGGDELIFNYLLAFGQGKTLLNCPPSFEVYALYGSMVGVATRDVWRDPHTMLPREDALLRAAGECDFAVLTSPNNPTGDLARRELVEGLLAACPGPVLVDEAYAEFACEPSAVSLAAPPASSVVDLLEQHDNLLVLHTLSKAFGMAGARVGYVIARPEVVSALAAVRQPYSVNSYSAAAALVAVRKRALFEPSVRAIVEARAALERRLAEVPGMSVWPSSANFVLARIEGAAEVRARLRDEHSVLVRDFSRSPGLRDCLRITVGTEVDNARLLRALAQVVQGR